MLLDTSSMFVMGKTARSVTESLNGHFATLWQLKTVIHALTTCQRVDLTFVFYPSKGCNEHSEEYKNISS